MKRTAREAIEAFKIIQEFCEDTLDCYGKCPFHNICPYITQIDIPPSEILVVESLVEE